MPATDQFDTDGSGCIRPFTRPTRGRPRAKSHDSEQRWTAEGGRRTPSPVTTHGVVDVPRTAGHRARDCAYIVHNLFQSTSINVASHPSSVERTLQVFRRRAVGRNGRRVDMEVCGRARSGRVQQELLSSQRAVRVITTLSSVGVASSMNPMGTIPAAAAGHQQLADSINERFFAAGRSNFWARNCDNGDLEHPETIASSLRYCHVVFWSEDEIRLRRMRT